MKSGQKESGSEARGRYSRNGLTRRAVGYIPVSAGMQAAEGLSRERSRRRLRGTALCMGADWCGSARA